MISTIFLCLAMMSYPLFCITLQEGIAIADTLEKQERYNDALTILQELHRTYPQDIGIAYKLGCFCCSIGNVQLAVDTFSSLPSMSAINTIQTYYNIGYTLKSAGRE